MKVTFCWTHISGYMAACWRELAATADLELKFVVQRSGQQSSFQDELMAGLDCSILDDSEFNDCAHVEHLVAAGKPDVVVICGWHHEPYRRLALQPEFADCRFLLTMDTPQKHNLRQWIGRIALQRFFRRMTGVVVAGERTWQYARYLGFSESQIHRGVYGFDGRAFAASIPLRQSLPGGWPKRFLYVGRYSQEKGLDTLVAAYRGYRSSVSAPWELSCCGRGPMDGLLREEKGVSDLGFIQPKDQPRVFAEHGAFVLPSHYEPWGVALAEAAGSGLPIVCTEACCSGIDIVRTLYNGFVVPTDDVSALAQALIDIDHRWCELEQMGQRSSCLAQPFAAPFWAKRWHNLLLGVKG